jgi:hypothetical protein
LKEVITATSITSKEAHLLNPHPSQMKNSSFLIQIMKKKWLPAVFIKQNPQYLSEKLAINSFESLFCERILKKEHASFLHSR